MKTVLSRLTHHPVKEASVSRVRYRVRTRHVCGKVVGYLQTCSSTKHNKDTSFFLLSTFTNQDSRQTSLFCPHTPEPEASLLGERLKMLHKAPRKWKCRFPLLAMAGAGCRSVLLGICRIMWSLCWGRRKSAEPTETDADCLLFLAHHLAESLILHT